MLHSARPEDPSNIKVVCRFRPLNDRELAMGSATCVSIEGNTVSMTSSDCGPLKFNFDAVFAPDSPQELVYEIAAKHTVKSVLEGFNGTIFAYGQTGSGKTFTMSGPSLEDLESRGVIPRMVTTVFEEMAAASADLEYTVKVAYAEIYMEKLKDLLEPENTGLQIREDKTRGVYIAGISEEYVSSEPEIYTLMAQGASNREVGSTLMNQVSSRSHSLFLLTISQTNKADFSAKTGKLYLVDLAGSEKVGKTGAEGRRLDEAKKINKSLSALGLVITSLTDGKSTHVPYRDSKLTRVLQDSLGGNSKTCLIVTCSPASYNEQETVSTLRFGVRAKAIKNKPKVNREVTVAELKLLLAKAEGELIKRDSAIAALKQILLEAGGRLPTDEELAVGGEEEKETDSGATQAFEELMEEMRGLREQGDDARKENDELREALRAEKDRCEHLAAENEENKQKLATVALRVATLQQQLQTREDEITRLKAHSQRLEAEAQVSAEQLLQAENRASQLLEKAVLPAVDTPHIHTDDVVERQASEIEELKSKINMMELNEIARASEDRISLEKERILEEERSKNRQLLERMESLRGRTPMNMTQDLPEYQTFLQSIAQSELEQQRNSWDADRSSLERDLANRIEKVVQLEMELDNMKETNNMLLRIMSGGDQVLHRHAARVEQEAQRHNSRAQKLLGEVKRLSQELQEQQEKNVSLEERLKEMEANLETSFVTIDDLWKAKEESERRRDQLSQFASMRSLSISRVKKVIRGGSRESATVPSVESDTE